MDSAVILRAFSFINYILVLKQVLLSISHRRVSEEEGNDMEQCEEVKQETRSGIFINKFRIICIVLMNISLKP